MLKRLGTRLRLTRQPSAPEAGVQLEEYDSHLPGTDRPARTPQALTQGCHRREAPARGPRCTVSRPGPGRRQLGDPACSQDGRAFPTRTPAVRAESVGRFVWRKGLPLKPGRRTVHSPVLTVSARLRRPAGLAPQETSPVGLGRNTVHCHDALHRARSRTRPRAARGFLNPIWSPPHVRRLGLGLPP